MRELGTVHHGRRPLTGFLAETYRRAHEEGTVTTARRYGLPLERVKAGLVHGCLYFRPVGVGQGNNVRPVPPVAVMKILARVHPELRRRNRAARHAWALKSWRGEVDGWFGTEREQVIAANLRFQGSDITGLDDRSLAAHVAELLSHFETQARTTIANHGGDMIPVGDYLAHCARWGISFSEAAALLRGSSPATTATAQVLAPAARAITASDRPPASVQAVRDLSADARTSVDEWLTHFGWRMLTTNDVDQPTLAERPEAQLAALLAAASRPAAPDAADAPDAAETRARIPASQRCSTSCWPRPGTGCASATTWSRSAGTGRPGCCGEPCSKQASGQPTGAAWTRSAMWLNWTPGSSNRSWSRGGPT